MRDAIKFCNDEKNEKALFQALYFLIPAENVC